MNRISALLTTILMSASSLPALSAEYPKVRIETTAGDILVELDDERAPLTVEKLPSVYRGRLLRRYDFSSCRQWLCHPGRRLHTRAAT